jgi:hypothetical protein
VLALIVVVGEVTIVVAPLPSAAVCETVTWISTEAAGCTAMVAPTRTSGVLALRVIALGSSEAA